jgi:hypothetical protein
LIGLHDAEKRSVKGTIRNFDAAEHRAGEDTIFVSVGSGMRGVGFRSQCHNSHADNSAVQPAAQANLPKILHRMSRRTSRLPRSYYQANSCSRDPEHDQDAW